MSKYVLADQGLKAHIELKFLGAPFSGVACSLDSPGHKVLCDATADELGSCVPYSLTGSLPLVKELQEAGFDLQIMGYGLMKTYHARNEYGLLSDFRQGFRIMRGVIQRLHLQAPN